jgi:uncharacterized protein (TIGR02444 family)
MHSDLWRFALDLYARPGIEQTCLKLQADGANVCLVLSAAWLGQLGVACTAARLAQLLELAAPWHDEVIRPLRNLRQGWKPAAKTDPELEVLREQVKALELEAERQLLARIESLAQAWAAVGADDLSLWLDAVVPSSARDNRGALQTLHAASASS